MIVTRKIISAQVTKARKARLRIHQSLLPETGQASLVCIMWVNFRENIQAFYSDRQNCLLTYILVSLLSISL